MILFIYVNNITHIEIQNDSTKNDENLYNKQTKNNTRSFHRYVIKFRVPYPVAGDSRSP